jgi:Lrp/AsnC family leucine-responsive transcriptional regulator/Lrp/AsnC family transcriptional regulator
MIDEKDQQIMDALCKNARLSTKQIAKKTNIPITTVFNRIKNLEKNGIIKNYTCIFDKKKLGRGVSANILLNINFDKLSKKMMNEEDLAEKLLKTTGVESVETISGEADMMIKVSVEDIDRLNDFLTKKLRGFEEIVNVKTFIILKNFSPGKVF